MPRRGKLGNAPGNDVHLTPPEVWDRVWSVGGGVVYDPCPHPFRADALGPEPWDITLGRIGYVNPPFSNIEAFADKSVVTAERGHT